MLPPSSLHFSRIGLGCVTFGREISEAAAHRLLDHALERGVTFFDTAAAYSGGASEAILGRWLAARRPPQDRLTIGTKLVPPYEPAAIRRSVEESLGRLGVDRLDLLYLHRWDATAESAAALQALDDLVRQGKIRALGVSNVTQEQLAPAIALQTERGWARFGVVQNNHNFAVRDAPPHFRRWCEEHGIAVVTYSPLGAGFLTGKHQHGVQAGSRFDVAPGHCDVYFHPQAYERLACLAQLAARTGHSQTALALAWALRQDVVASTLVGGRSPAHLDQAFAALALPEDIWQEERCS
jgi:aryl-alcohol dehydrogenase-like predicted oxidoreductase